MGASSGQPVGGASPFGTARPDTSMSVNEEHKPVILFAAFRPRDALWDRGRDRGGERATPQKSRGAWAHWPFREGGAGGGPSALHLGEQSVRAVAECLSPRPSPVPPRAGHAGHAWPPRPQDPWESHRGPWELRSAARCHPDGAGMFAPRLLSDLRGRKQDSRDTNGHAFYSTHSCATLSTQGRLPGSDTSAAPPAGRQLPGRDAVEAAVPVARGAGAAHLEAGGEERRMPVSGPWSGAPHAFSRAHTAGEEILHVCGPRGLCHRQGQAGGLEPGF